MLTVSIPRFIAILVVVLSGLLAMPLARASTVDDLKACFIFLNSQDYARAEQAAQTLLRRTDLDRGAQLYAWLCLGKAYDGIGRAKDALQAFKQVEMDTVRQNGNSTWVMFCGKPESTTQRKQNFWPG
ncbi:MAG: hypothetical protein EPO42_04980 [Gallionellaceae bacterium]|nr:MAG: hypothetical protein EPO42_04980 [Gallionellaceae bacterium]